MSRASYFNEPSQLEINKKIVRRAFLISFAVFCVFFITTLSSWNTSVQSLKIRQGTAFEGLTAEMTDKIRDEFFRYLELIRNMQAFFEGSVSVERDEFRAFARIDNLSQNFPGLVALRYIEVVPERESEEFVRTVRADDSLLPGGHPDFDLRPMTSDRRYFSSRAEHYAIKYVEPFSGNEKMLGLDLASDQVRRSIYERAWMTGKFSFGKIDEHTSGKSAFVIALPFYSGIEPSGSILEKKKALKGFVDVVISPGGFFLPLFKGAALFSQIGYEVYDGDVLPEKAGTPNLIFTNLVEDHDPDRFRKAPFKTRRILKMADHDWTIFFYAPEDFRYGEIGSETPLIIFSQGILLSFLIWGILYVLSSSRFRAVMMASRITVDVQESEQRIRALAQSATDAVVSADENERIIFWNDGAKEIFGYEESQVMGKPLMDLFPLRIRKAHNVGDFRKLSDQGADRRFEKVISFPGLRRDGSEFPAELSISTWKRNDKDFLTVIIRDVSEQEKLRREIKESRDRYAKLIEDNPDPMLTIDESGVIGTANAAAEAMIGTLRNEVSGKSLDDLVFFPPDSVERFKKEFERSLKDQTHLPFEVKIKPVAGPSKTYEVNLQLLRTLGKIESFLAVFRDLTERKKVERIQKIEHEVTKILAAAGNVEIGIVQVIEMIKKEFEWQAGAFWVPDDLKDVLKCMVSLPSPGYEEYGSINHALAFKKGEGLPGKTLKMGRPFWCKEIASDPDFQRKEMSAKLGFVSAVAFPVTNQGAVLGVLEFLGTAHLQLDQNLLNLFEMIAQQIGQFIWRKRTESQLQEAEQALGERERMAMVSQLAAGVAHEVKNPLAIILQGAEYLKSEGGIKNPVVIEVLESMKEAVLRADKIVKGLVELSRPEMLVLHSEDLNAVIETSLLLMKGRIDQTSIRTAKKLHPDLPKIMIDRGKVEQVFINLFANAVDSMKSEGVLTVRTRMVFEESRASQVIAEVEDSGPGVPEQILGKLFTPFVTGKRAQGGSGLGLPVVRSIMEMHGGKVDLENIKPRGAKVTLVFPCDAMAKGTGGTA